MKRTIYECDTCRKTIVGEDFLIYNEAREGEVYSKELLIVNRRFLIAMGVTESTRYEFHFCSRDCLTKWANR